MDFVEKQTATNFAVCVKNDGYELDLEPLKLYRVLPDETLEPEDMRVVDESGEDYIYPAEYFAPVLTPGTPEHVLMELMRSRPGA